MPRYVDLSKMPQLETWGCCCEGENYAFVTVADVIQALRQAEAQTGEAEPVVHGYWIQIDDGVSAKCGICGACACDLDEGFEEFAKSYRYCPHCGAKMDGETQNEKPKG